MIWWHHLVALPAAMFLINGIPHLVQGVSGKPFPSPFSGGPPHDDRIPERNVLWGSANLIIGGVLLWTIRGGLHNWLLVVELVIVAIATAVLLARLMSGRMRVRRRS